MPPAVRLHPLTLQLLLLLLVMVGKACLPVCGSRMQTSSNCRLMRKMHRSSLLCSHGSSKKQKQQQR
jgi:hypothetical protein